MAAYFFTNNDTNVFKIIPITQNVNIGFLNDFVNGALTFSATGTQTGFNISPFNQQAGLLIISEVVFQNKDTIQYFLTFDDLITYFYFGKGLGTISISGQVMADCDGNWFTLNNFMQYLGSLRGKRIGTSNKNYLTIGGISFEAVLSSFTVRANTDVNSLYCVDFTLQLDILDSSFIRPVVNASCY